MSNILYIGPYREFTGQGSISRAYIHGLLQAGHNVSTRPIYNISKIYPESAIDNSILELENNSNKKYHCVIQHCYPHQYCFDSRFDKNIGICDIGSYGYNNNLKDFLEIPDEIIVPSEYTKYCITHNSNVKTNINVIPPPIDIENISRYQQIAIKKDSIDKFYFYIICNFASKSNITKIIESFWTVFGNTEDVELIIKTKSKTHDSENLGQAIEYELAKLNHSFGRSFKRPKVMFGDISNEAIYYIHNNNDCYIDLCLGKSFGSSVLEAAVFGNSIITIKNTAQSEIIKNTNNFLVDSFIDTCRDDSRTYFNYNTINQKWRDVIFDDLIKQLKLAYLESDKDKNIRKLKTKENIQKYSLSSVSTLLKNI